MVEFWPGLAAPLFNGVALMLALGFRRNRAAVILALLTCASLAICGFAGPHLNQRGAEATRMFLPWLLLIAAALPERRLLARRNLLLLALLAITVWLTLYAPEHIWPKLRNMFPLGWLPWKSGLVATGMVLIASVFCLSRWLLARLPMEFSLGLVLLVVGVSLLPQVSSPAASTLMIVCGAIAVVAILHSSYRMAFVDGLAGLPNRRALDEALARLSGDFALAMIDVDHFKMFNDRNGHAAGDRALKAVAGQLKTTRGCDAFRYGGEEFCLLFTGARTRHAREACEDLRKRAAALRLPVRSQSDAKRRQASARRDAGTVKLTISIGLAVRTERVRAAVDVLKVADKALYAAKSQGRNRVVSK
ncbi:GGDEF domain-containing protein [Dokdonella sp.]|uniref:GGDEF domain-containing protein n=1 Tax=Dokdonella sp. TaxID=2291710 RepID=UPI003527F2F2